MSQSGEKHAQDYNLIWCILMALRVIYFPAVIYGDPVPQALYGLEAFPNMDEAQYKMLKEMFRNAMAIALGIPKTVCIPSKRWLIYKMYKCIAF